jgi:hypothetical protein
MTVLIEIARDAASALARVSVGDVATSPRADLRAAHASLVTSKLAATVLVAAVEAVLDESTEWTPADDDDEAASTAGTPTVLQGPDVPGSGRSLVVDGWKGLGFADGGRNDPQPAVSSATATATDPTGRKAKVLALLAAKPEGTLSIAEARTHLREDEPALGLNQVQQLLKRMCDRGQIERVHKGLYRRAI